MNFFKKLRSENLIPFILFLIILINYIPLFKGNFVSDISNSYAVTTKEMTICFAIELVLLATFLLGRIKVFKTNTIINFTFLLITTIILAIIQRQNYLSQNYEQLDVINIVCIFLNILMLFIAFTNLKIEEKYMTYFFAGMVFAGLVASAVNIYLYKEEILTMITTAKQISVKSFFAHRNQFAVFLYVSIISNIMLILRANKKRVKALLFIPLIIFVASIITTSSRTGIAATALFIVLFFITTRSIKVTHKFFIVYLLTFFVISGFVITGNKYPEKMLKVENFVNNVLIRENTISSFTGRDKFWEIAIDVLQKNKINMSFGIGRFLAVDLIEEYHVTQFHNFYIEALMTGGIMELVFFIYIHIFTLVKVFISKIDKKYKLFYLSMFISLAIYGMFESMSRFSIGCADTLCLIFFVTIPLLHSNTYQKSEEDKEQKLEESEIAISPRSRRGKHSNNIK